MRMNRVKKLWREGKPTVGGWLSIPNGFAAEVMAHTGLDWLCVDMQHGCIDYSDAVPMLTAISTTNVTPIVRVPWNEPAMIMKVLDAGAYGVIVPMVSNRAEAERAVGACRYPPAGMRSNGPNRVLLYAGSDYQKHANDEVICAVMIETAEGIEKMDEIISTPAAISTAARAARSFAGRTAGTARTPVGCRHLPQNRRRYVVPAEGSHEKTGRIVESRITLDVSPVRMLADFRLSTRRGSAAPPASSATSL